MDLKYHTRHWIITPSLPKTLKAHLLKFKCQYFKSFSWGAQKWKPLQSTLKTAKIRVRRGEVHSGRMWPLLRGNSQKRTKTNWNLVLLDSHVHSKQHHRRVSSHLWRPSQVFADAWVHFNENYVGLCVTVFWHDSWSVWSWLRGLLQKVH